MDGEIYMNNAATSFPKPDCVAEAVAGALRARPGSAHRGGIESFDVFSQTRRALARLMGVSAPERIALGPNSTWGLNLAIQGFPLKPGDAVLSTDAEHNSVLRPLYRLWKERDINVRYVSVLPDGGVDPEAWLRAAHACRPKLCVFTHASNVTGRVNPAARLAAVAHDVGAAALVDASQTLGCVPVRAEEWGVDMLAFTGHKYLLGPQGTGGLYVRPGLELSPLLLGGTGVKSDLETMPDEMPTHLEAGHRERAVLLRTACRAGVGGEKPGGRLRLRSGGGAESRTQGRRRAGDRARRGIHPGGELQYSRPERRRRGLRAGGGLRHNLPQRSPLRAADIPGAGLPVVRAAEPVPLHRGGRSPRRHRRGKRNCRGLNMRFECQKTENCFAASETWEYRLPETAEAFSARLDGWDVKENRRYRRPMMTADRGGVNIKGVLAGNVVRVSFPEDGWEAEKARFENWLAGEEAGE
jgi:hypothetical protein